MERQRFPKIATNVSLDMNCSLRNYVFVNNVPCARFTALAIELKHTTALIYILCRYFAPLLNSYYLVRDPVPKTRFYSLVIRIFTQRNGKTHLSGRLLNATVQRETLSFYKHGEKFAKKRGCARSRFLPREYSRASLYNTGIRCRFPAEYATFIFFLLQVGTKEKGTRGRRNKREWTYNGE